MTFSMEVEPLVATEPDRAAAVDLAAAVAAGAVV